MTLQKPVALITGGGGGIGRATAARLALSHRIVIADVNVDANVAIDDGVVATGVACDVSSEDSVAACLARVEADVGPIEALVTLAGIIQERHFPPESFAQLDWDRVLDINAKGTWICCRLIGGAMAARGHGSIVTVSSVAGHRSWPTHAYGPSKAALMSITRNLAVEWGRSGVRVNSVSPGFTRTRRMEGARTDAVRHQ